MVFKPWTLDPGPWTLDAKPWTLDLVWPQVECLDCLPEYRMRLISGFKQTFRAKFVEGLINGRSLRFLVYCCNIGLHK